MKSLQNDRYLKALFQQPVDRTPIWIMRQAGRHLPEYRQLRAETPDFLTFCKTPELACEATLQPLRRYALDAAIIFSDILTVPEAMGLELQFLKGEGPQFSNPIRTREDIKQLSMPDPSVQLAYVGEAIARVKRELNGKVPLIGFSGSPWTLATYMVEGGGSKQFDQIKGLLYEEPQHLHALLSCLSQVVTDYINMQIEHGVDAIMLFDTWGGVLTPEHYREFSLQYMQKIVNEYQRQSEHKTIPITLFTKGSGLCLSDLAQSGCDGVGIDWTIPIEYAREKMQNKVALQGNLDPCALLGSMQSIEANVSAILKAYGQSNGHIFNLGHGVLPTTSPEKVEFLVNTVHRLSQKD